MVFLNLCSFIFFIFQLIAIIRFGMKRFFNDDGDDRIPAVEKLYRQNQETYATAGGFDEYDDWCEEKREKILEAVQKKRDLPFEHLVAPDECKDCGGALYSDAILWNRFNYPVCDLCRDETDRHKLIARTEAKERYLLKDCDLDLRKPPLRFVSRKNPHNARYGDMKLYLKPQLEARALELYGSFEKLEEQRENRERQRKATAEKRFEQKIQQIRKEISGTSRQAAMRAASVHEHRFGDEMRDEKSGEYCKCCTVCGYEMRYEKM